MSTGQTVPPAEHARDALRCRACARRHPLDDIRWRCDCGGLLDIAWEPALDPDAIVTRQPSLWRYRDALPLIEACAPVTLGEGFTPLLPMTFDSQTVWVKQDHLFPTGSYKDRGASVLVSQVRGLGVERVVEDSSGNAGSAIAAYCAHAGIQCTIYVPESTSPAKLEQIQAYGAKLVRVPGSREDTARAVWEAAQTAYYASHSWNPFFFHGTKTFAYEVVEQLNWRAPDSVVLPVGNGTLLLGAAIGFEELRRAGIIRHRPRLVGVQAAACAPLCRAYHAQAYEVPAATRGQTMAEGIAIAEPVRGEQILQAVRQSGGTMIAVEEDAIDAALHDLWRQGFYVEPTAAATIAGLRQYLRDLDRDESIVSVLTGHGLKAAGHG
jgi:threonine synthase